MKPRVVHPELLDELPPDDPRAIHSRRDLRRINAIMANASYLLDFLFQSPAGTDGRSITLAEIGSGDGTITSKVTCAFAQEKIHGHAILIDRQPSGNIQQDGWTFEKIKADVFDWLESAPHCDVIIANLFLHHFEDDRLRELLAKIAKRSAIFAAVEPRRSAFAEFAARQVGLIGCNDVTRNDAVISVRAGFQNSELSERWPDRDGWKLTERKAGLFSHFFGAIRA